MFLSGRAAQWATVVIENCAPPSVNYEAFTAELQRVFDQGSEAMTRLFSFCQMSSSVADYSIQFWIYATEGQWNDAALQGAFLTGLKEELKDELAVRDESLGLKSLISLSIFLDNHLRER